MSDTAKEKPKRIITLNTSTVPIEMLDFNKYKTLISLPDFLIDNYGFKPDDGSSLRYPKLKNDVTGEILVIKINSKNQYTYFDIHDDSVKGRSILDFVQKELAKDHPNGKQPSLITVVQTLDGYMTSGKVVAPDSSKYYLENTVWNKDNNFNEIKSLKEINNNDFLKSRGFSENILESPLFKGVFFEKSYNKDGIVHTNTVIKLYNYEGLAGLSQRNTSFKGCLGNRFDALATSIPTNGKESDVYYLGESFLDCVAHYELNEKVLKDRNVAYLSSEGAITSGQIALLNKFIQEKNPKEIVTIFDKDLAGMVYNLKVNSELHLNGKTSNSVVTFHEDKVNQMVYLSISNLKGNNDEFEKTLLSIFSKSNFAEYPAANVQLMVNDINLMTYQIAIPREYNMLERVIEKIQELRFGPEKNISIEKPITLDFNDDLMAIKGMHPDWQIMEIDDIQRVVYQGNLLPF